MSDYLSELKKAFTAVHGCTAQHTCSVPYAEVFRGKIVWEGKVECFSLSGHPKAEAGYGWGHKREDGMGWEITTVLKINPVVSPQTAVRAAIAAQIKRS